MQSWFRRAGKATTIFAAVFLTAIPAARAADPGQIDCPLTALASADRANLARLLAESAAMDDATRAPMRQAVAQCAATLGWSPEIARYAGIFAVASIGEAEFRRRLATLGIDVTELEQAVLADDALRAVAGTFVISEADGTAFATRHSPLIMALVGSQAQAEPATTLIGNYIGARALKEAGRLRFAAN